MSQIKNYACVETPVPSALWVFMDDDQRMRQIVNSMESANSILIENIEAVMARGDGQVIVRLKQSQPAKIRGSMLLDLEEHFKKTIDVAITVWLEPLGDRNSLRNFRGIEVKQ